MTPTWCCPGSLAVSTEAGRSPLLGQLSWGTDAGDSRGLGNNSQEGNCIIHFFCRGISKWVQCQAWERACV